MKRGMSIHQLRLDHAECSGNESLVCLQDVRSNIILLMGKYPFKGRTWRKLDKKLYKVDKRINSLINLQAMPAFA